MPRNVVEEWLHSIEPVDFLLLLKRCCFEGSRSAVFMAEELTELEARIFEWIRQSDFETVAWSTPKAAKSFKVKEDEVYEAVAALTRKVPDRIQVFYKQGSLHIAAE
ncbi:MAG TPA: hypothetical protein QF401_06585 [Candidatus Poseidoniaceae archaeon]|jgi:hypothetical protein|nr:hypothetical protein [Candidatus Poseidoniaceae archaeon]